LSHERQFIDLSIYTIADEDSESSFIATFSVPVNCKTGQGLDLMLAAEPTIQYTAWSETKPNKGRNDLTEGFQPQRVLGRMVIVGGSGTGAGIRVTSGLSVSAPKGMDGVLVVDQGTSPLLMRDKGVGQ
jgi:hypothetical protein